MKQQLNSKEAELYKRCDEVLHYIWDPIGVAGEPNPRDEYDGYLPQIFALVRDNALPESVVYHLRDIEETQMGLAVKSNKIEFTVECLFKWRDFIWASPLK